MDIITYALTKKIAEGAVSGVDNMSVSGQTLTINCKDGTVLTMDFPTPADGVGISDIQVSGSGSTRTLTFTMTDNTTKSVSIPVIQGDKGETGDSATITIGTVTTVEPTESATVTNSGDTHNAVFDFSIPKGEQGEEGKSIESASIDSNNHLILAFTDGSEYDAGEVPKGEDGVSPTVVVKTQTADSYVLTITDSTGSFDTPNLKGDGAEELSALSDVVIATPTSGQVLKYDAGNEVWINGDGSTVSYLTDLGDVTISSVLNRNILIYDSATSRWKNMSYDTTPTQYSSLPISSGGTYTAIKTVDSKIGELTNLNTTIKSNIVEAVNEVEGEVGDLTTLTTTTQTDLVSAVNEVNATVGELSDDVGDISTLTTTDTTSVVNAINELVTEYNQLDYVEHYSTMPTASEKANATVQYIGTTNSDYTKGYFYTSTPSVVEGSIVYSWVQTDVQSSVTDYDELSSRPQINSVTLTGDKTLSDLGIQSILQYTTLPTASVDLISKVYQYTGATTSDYITNYFYQCVYDTDSASYVWKNVDVSSNTALDSRISTLETNQGDITTLEVSGATDIVTALNVLNVRGISSITYAKPYLTITLRDDSTYVLDISAILATTELGDLADVLVTNIADTNLIQYDSSISKYKPYDVVTALTTVYNNAKDYTDQQIASSVQDDAYYCDAKPTCSYDSSSDSYIVVYYQNSIVHTTTDTDSRFYYKDSNDDPYCTSWFITGDSTVDPVEFTYLVSSANFDDYVNKNTDVVSTYTTDMTDKTKVPNIASMDALYAIIASSLALKVNVADIVDNLTTTTTTVPLSANQGYVLATAISTKQDTIQLDSMPTASATYLGKVYEYTGSTTSAYTKGRFYECVYNSTTDVYSWSEIEMGAEVDTVLDATSTNPIANSIVTTTFNTKQNQTLSTPITVSGVSQTTVESALSALATSDTAKQNQTLDTPITIDGTTYSTVESALGGLNSKSVTLDTVMSNTSTNGVTNATITSAMQLQQGFNVTLYASESNLPTQINFATGVICGVGQVAWCVSEKTWHRVTAIDSSTLAITWSSYDPHISAEIEAGDGIEISSTDGSVNVIVDDSTTFINSSTNAVEGLAPNSSDFSTDTTNKTVELAVSQRVFSGTTAEWNALTTAQKTKYGVVNLTDDAGSGLTVTDTISLNNYNIPTSDAVFKALCWR